MSFTSWDLATSHNQLCPSGWFVAISSRGGKINLVLLLTQLEGNSLDCLELAAGSQTIEEGTTSIGLTGVLILLMMLDSGTSSGTGSDTNSNKSDPSNSSDMPDNYSSPGVFDFNSSNIRHRYHNCVTLSPEQFMAFHIFVCIEKRPCKAIKKTRKRTLSFTPTPNKVRPQCYQLSTSSTQPHRL